MQDGRRALPFALLHIRALPSHASCGASRGEKTRRTALGGGDPGSIVQKKKVTVFESVRESLLSFPERLPTLKILNATSTFA